MIGRWGCFRGSLTLTMIGSWGAIDERGSFAVGISDILGMMSCDITGRDGGGRVRGGGMGTY